MRNTPHHSSVSSFCLAIWANGLKYLPGVMIGLLLSFLIAANAHAATSTTTACGFGLLACDEQGVVWGVDSIPNDSLLAQLGSRDGLAELIISVGIFLNRIILPLLVAIGLFLFLYYLARFFIIDAASTAARDEAKSRAIWGLAAFVFIAILWGIVNMFVNGFNIDRERSICPDYLGSWCGNLGTDSAGGGYTGNSNLDFGNPSSLPSGGAGTGGAVGSGGSTGPTSKLGELLFGRYQDTADYNFRTGAPRASTSAVTISPNTTCVDGFTTLGTAADIETLQSAYLLTLSSSGIKWLNVTDNTSQTNISYDAEWLRDPANDAEKVALVHTHPQATIESLGLPMSGHPSSISDFEGMCDDVLNNALFVTVDQNQLWVAESIGAMCPRRAIARDILIAISTLLHLSTVGATERNNEFNLLYNWDDLPRNAKNAIRDYLSTDFNALSAAAIVTMADDLARGGGMKVTRMSAGDFCTAF